MHIDLTIKKKNKKKDRNLVLAGIVTNRSHITVEKTFNII
jgi:hypothetical protein